MPRFGLIGYPLAHSYSAALFQRKWAAERLTGYRYDLMPMVDLSSMRQMILATPDLEGFNVTIPHKQAIIPYLDVMSDEARGVGAVNTVKIQRLGSDLKLFGYNTDVAGIRACVQHLPGECTAIVFGSGGASAAVRFVLAEMKIPSLVVSRVPIGGAIPYSALDARLIGLHQLLVNCTPAGMSGFDAVSLPLPYEGITAGHQLFDLVYNPPVTPFLKAGLAVGATCISGYRMLAAQAEAAWRIWTSGEGEL